MRWPLRNTPPRREGLVRDLARAVRPRNTPASAGVFRPCPRSGMTGSCAPRRRGGVPSRQERSRRMRAPRRRGDAPAERLAAQNRGLCSPPMRGCSAVRSSPDQFARHQPHNSVTRLAPTASHQLRVGAPPPVRGGHQRVPEVCRPEALPHHGPQHVASCRVAGGPPPASWPPPRGRW